MSKFKWNEDCLQDAIGIDSDKISSTIENLDKELIAYNIENKDGIPTLAGKVFDKCKTDDEFLAIMCGLYVFHIPDRSGVSFVDSED